MSEITQTVKYGLTDAIELVEQAATALGLMHDQITMAQEPIRTTIRFKLWRTYQCARMLREIAEVLKNVAGEFNQKA